MFNVPLRKPKPMWEYPPNHDFGADEGFNSFVKGYLLEDNPYGETLWGKSWTAGWKQAERKWLLEKAKTEDK